MDDLTFRRSLYAEPNCNDLEIMEAAQEDRKKQAFRDEIIAFDEEIAAALAVEVPENLAEKLLLRQSIVKEKKEKAQKPYIWAMAASFALAAVLSFALITPNNDMLTQDALAHMSHVKYEVANNQTVDMQTVNAKLANYNGKLSEGLGKVLSANFCYLDKVKSLHLIMEGEQGLVSLFVLPEEMSYAVDGEFSNQYYNGMSFLLASARLIVIGENDSDIESFSKLAKQAMQFSA